MTKPNNGQARTEQRTRCEYYGCTITFARRWDKRRHEKEQHGPLICCTYPGCEWATRRVAKLRTHLINTHHKQVSINLALPSEFRPATAQTLASLNCLSASDANASFNFDPTTPPISIDYTITPQASPDGFKSHTTLHSEGASTPEHNPTFSLSAATSRTRVQAAPRIFKPRRVVRRRPKLRPTARTSPAASSQSRLGSSVEATPDFYSSGRGNLNGFMQWMPHTSNAESFAGILDSLSLLDSSIGGAGSTSNQQTSNGSLRRFDPSELDTNPLWGNHKGGWDMMNE